MINNKDTRVTSMISFWCLYCELWADFTLFWCYDCWFWISKCWLVVIYSTQSQDVAQNPKDTTLEGNFLFVLIRIRGLTGSWRWSLLHRNQSINLLCNSMDWFPYDRDHRHKRFKPWKWFVFRKIRLKDLHKDKILSHIWFSDFCQI